MLYIGKERTGTFPNNLVMAPTDTVTATTATTWYNDYNTWKSAVGDTVVIHWLDETLLNKRKLDKIMH